MNLDKLKEFFNNLGAHDLPTGAAALVGIVLLFLVFKTGKSFFRLVLFFIAVGLFAGAWWWHQHK
jgi:high-affinity Fe2+/Pb2+ permease